MALTQGGETHRCDKLKELADATSMTLKLIDQGFKLHKVTEEAASLRLSICEGCTQFIVEERRCAECCCPMDFKVTLKYDPVMGIMKKTLIECPIGKW